MNKINLNIILLILGIAAVISAFFVFKESLPKTISGVIIGLGGGIISLSISNLFNINIENKYPEQANKIKIENNDERNNMIRTKAKAKSGDVVQWLVIAIAYITILISSPLWLTLIIVAVFLFKNILEIYLISKYQKNM